MSEGHRATVAVQRSSDISNAAAEGTDPNCRPGTVEDAVEQRDGAVSASSSSTPSG